MEWYILLAIAWMIGFGGLTGWLAAQKGRNAMAWALLGALMGVFAMLAVGLAPAVGELQASVRYEPPSGRPSAPEGPPNWKCWQCGNVNTSGVDTCSCGASRLG